MKLSAQMTASAALLLILASTVGCTKLKARDQLVKGIESFKSGKYEAAVDYFQKSVALDPTSDVSRLYLATAYSYQVEIAPRAGKRRRGGKAPRVCGERSGQARSERASVAVGSAVQRRASLSAHRKKGGGDRALQALLGHRAVELSRSSRCTRRARAPWRPLRCKSLAP